MDLVNSRLETLVQNVPSAGHRPAICILSLATETLYLPGRLLIERKSIRQLSF